MKCYLQKSVCRKVENFDKIQVFEISHFEITFYYKAIDFEALGDQGLFEVVEKRNSRRARRPLWHEMDILRGRGGHSGTK